MGFALEEVKQNKQGASSVLTELRVRRFPDANRTSNTFYRRINTVLSSVEKEGERQAFPSAPAMLSITGWKGCLLPRSRSQAHVYGLSMSHCC